MALSSSCGSDALLAILSHSRSEACNRVLLRDLANREFNAFLWFSLIAVTAFLLSRVVKLLCLWAKARSIPGPPCPSFYGHCKLISRENFTGPCSFHSLMPFLFRVLFLFFGFLYLTRVLSSVGFSSTFAFGCWRMNHE